MLTDLDRKIIRYIITIYFCVRFTYLNCFLGTLLFVLTGHGLSNVLLACTLLAIVIEYHLCNLLEKHDFVIGEILDKD